MIRLEHIHKKLGSFHLQDVNLELPDGYIMGLVGANGAGKTTLIQTMLGLYRPDKGTIYVDEKPWLESSHEHLDQIGYVLMDELFDPALSLLDNANYYGAYYKQYDRELLRAYFVEFDLDEKKKYRRFSKGEKLKFEVAFALSHHPKYLLMDEPAGNFDLEFTEVFYRLVKEFVSDGAHSVLLSTHQTDEIEQIVDYVTMLHEGSVIFSKDIEELHESYKVVQGERYKIELLPKEYIIYIEESMYGASALIEHHRRNDYDALTVSNPSIEDVMYYLTKGGAL